MIRRLPRTHTCVNRLQLLRPSVSKAHVQQKNGSGKTPPTSVSQAPSKLSVYRGRHQKRVDDWNAQMLAVYAF
jgi:hypothetical protein